MPPPPLKKPNLLRDARVYLSGPMDFVASRAFEDRLALDPRLRHGVANEFARLAPLVDYLCAALDLEF